MTATASSNHTAPHEHLTHAAPVLVSPMAPVPWRTAGSRLGPEEDFPEDLTGLGMADLQVLHSRITRQLDHDYLTDPAGPHSATLDRCQELLSELNTRDAARGGPEPSRTGTP